MSDRKDGGPAFPTIAGQTVYSHGMYLRDWFAGQALVGMGDINPNLPDHPANTHFWPDPQDLVERRAKLAYLQADAMLAAREAKP